MKKINLDVNLFGLDGKTLKDNGGQAVSLKTIVANHMVAQKSKSDAIRQMEVARKIYASKGEIELEDADFALLKDLEKDAPWTTITEAAFLECMKRAESVPSQSKSKPKKAA
jgi:hypothetical protein